MIIWETFNSRVKKKILLHLFRNLLRTVSSRSLTELVHTFELQIIFSVVSLILEMITEYSSENSNVMWLDLSIKAFKTSFPSLFLNLSNHTPIFSNNKTHIKTLLENTGIEHKLSSPILWYVFILHR